jgi:uncharacterized protein
MPSLRIPRAPRVGDRVPPTLLAPAEQPTGQPPVAAESVDRIGALDILRGIALLGMFLVHFNDNAIAGNTASGLSAMYQRMVTLFFEERFWAMFGILFGVGFAVQFRRAEARGAAFAAIYIRRLIGLAGFGFFAHAVFGHNVLLGYAVWGAPLLLARRWSPRMLMIALLVSAASGSLFTIARATYRVTAVGEATYRAERAAVAAQNQTFNEGNRAAQDAPDYPAVFRARLRHMAWFYMQPFSFLPVNSLTLFLIGVIGFRLGLFDTPGRHQRLLMTLMAFGAASWVADRWLLPANAEQLGSPLVRELVIDQLKTGFGVIRDMWLAFAYIGAVLLLVARNSAWLRWLAPFGWSGRMALTTYMVQIAILDLTFSNYSLHLEPTPLQALGAGLALFAVSAALSRWWLSRFRFGPLEWLWRSISYGRLQPWRADSVAAAVAAG